MNAPAAKAGAPAKPERPSRLRWLVGWVLVPGAVLAALFAFGLHLGANRPEAWYVRAVAWVAGLGD